MKATVLNRELDDVKMDGSYGSIAALGNAKWFVEKIRVHNAAVDAMRKDDHHLTPGTVLVIGTEVSR